MLDFETYLARLPDQSVLCVGDLMLDQFVYGEVSRVSPEAPVPVIAVKREETQVGGAGNVACNIASLGASCVFVGVVGDDEAGQTLAAALGRLNARLSAELVADPERPTTRKLRFVSEHYSSHLLRADWERPQPLGAAIETWSGGGPGGAFLLVGEPGIGKSRLAIEIAHGVGDQIFAAIINADTRHVAYDLIAVALIMVFVVWRTASGWRNYAEFQRAQGGDEGGLSFGTYFALQLLGAVTAGAARIIAVEMLRGPDHMAMRMVISPPPRP